MNIYLCSLSDKYPENYLIGLKSQKWGIEEKYGKKNSKVEIGDKLVFDLSLTNKTPIKTF